MKARAECTCHCIKQMPTLLSTSKNKSGFEIEAAKLYTPRPRTLSKEEINDTMKINVPPKMDPHVFLYVTNINIE